MQLGDIFVYRPDSDVHWDHLCLYWHGRAAGLQDHTAEDDRACSDPCRGHPDHLEAPLLHQHPQEEALCGYS